MSNPCPRKRRPCRKWASAWGGGGGTGGGGGGHDGTGGGGNGAGDAGKGEGAVGGFGGADGGSHMLHDSMHRSITWHGWQVTVFTADASMLSRHANGSQFSSSVSAVMKLLQVKNGWSSHSVGCVRPHSAHGVDIFDMWVL